MFKSMQEKKMELEAAITSPTETLPSSQQNTTTDGYVA